MKVELRWTKDKDVFVLLCSKCNPISKDLGVDIGSFVLKKLIPHLKMNWKKKVMGLKKNIKK